MEPLCNCNMHQSGTIPLLLTRTSIVLKETNAPIVPKNFITDFELSGDIAYTTRLLRSGYVYAYDEVKKKWYDYYVTPGGYYFHIPQGAAFNESSINNSDFNCLHTADSQGISSFISVKAYKDGLFYLIWSPVRWTEKTREKFDSKDFREKYMQRFDTGGWWDYVMANQDAPDSVINCEKLHQLDNIIAEYNFSTCHEKSLFERRSSSNWAGKSSDFAKMVKRASDRVLYNGGAILNLSDPSGLAADISALMKGVSNDKTINNEKDEFNRDLNLHMTISAIIENAKQSYSLLKNDSDHFMSGPESYLADALNFNLEAKKDLFDNFERQITERYHSHINQSKRKEFIQLYQSTMEQLSENILKPLSQLHVQVMDSDLLVSQFNNHFDENEGNKKQGLEYSTLFISCIKDTQEHPLCARQQENWFVTDDNLLQNSICFNQQNLKKELKKVFPQSNEPKIDSSNIIGLIDKALSEDHSFLLGHLINELSRVSTSLLTKDLNTKSSFINATLSRLVRMTGKRFVIIQTNGNINSLISTATNTIKQYLDITGGKEAANLNKVLAARFEYLKLKGSVQVGNKMSTGYVVILDNKDFNKINDIKSKIMTVEGRDQLIKQSITSHSKSGAIFAVKVLGIIAQISSLMDLYSKLDKGAKYERQFIAGMASLVYLPINIGINRLVIPRIASAILQKRIGNTLGVFGAILGFGMGVCDIIEAIDHKGIYNELAFVDLLSGLFSLTFAGLLLIKGPISWMIGLWMLGLFIMIEYQKALTEITDVEKWMMCTKWGIVSNKLTEEEKSHLVPFLSMKQELDGLKVIISEQD